MQRDLHATMVDVEKIVGREGSIPGSSARNVSWPIATLTGEVSDSTDTRSFHV